MRTKKIVFVKLYAAALICAALTGITLPPVAFAKPRGNSGLPPGPGNPLAALQLEIDALDKRVDDLENAASQPALMWIQHLDLLPGDGSVLTSFNSTTSGVGGGLAGLIIQSTTTGEVDLLAGNKVVEKAIQVPPRFTITGVRVCYELSSAASFISQIRLAQVQDPPSTANVLLDDATDHTAVGPVCFDSAVTSVDPSLGPVLLSLRVNFGSTSDKIVLRGLGLHLVPTP
jgi:hypothetical protein